MTSLKAFPRSSSLVNNRFPDGIPVRVGHTVFPSLHKTAHHFGLNPSAIHRMVNSKHIELHLASVLLKRAAQKKGPEAERLASEAARLVKEWQELPKLP